MKRLLLLSVFLATLASAEDWEWQKPTSKITGAAQVFGQPIRSMPTALSRFDAESETSLSNAVFAFKASPWVYARVPDAEAGTEKRSRVFFEMKEGWAEFVKPDYELRVGNQIFAWGAADQLNPTDVWNPKDLYDPFQSPKLPLASARLKVHPESWSKVSVEMVGTPFFRPTRLPVRIPDSGIHDVDLSDSRWLLPMPTTVQLSDTFAPPLLYKIEEASYDDKWQAGGRLQVSQIGGWDFSLYGFSGVESQPRIAFTRQGSANTPALPITLTLHPSFHRQQMYGLDATGSVSPFDLTIGLRCEAAFFHRDNSKASSQDLVRDDYVHAVAGADYTFQKKVLGTVLYVNLQYVHYQTVDSKETRPGSVVVSGLPKVIPWDKNLVFFWENRIDSKYKFAGNVVGSLDYRDGLFTPQFHAQWSDAFKTVLSADFFFGNKDGFFGQFSDNRRAMLSGTLTF